MLTRWFVLDDAAGIFSYYTSKSKMSRGERRGCVRLRGALIGIDDEDDSTFTITVDNKTFHFQVRFYPNLFYHSTDVHKILVHYILKLTRAQQATAIDKHDYCVEPDIALVRIRNSP